MKNSKSPVAVLIIAISLIFLSPVVFSHSGGTNADGCHTNRSTGDYHCHTPKSSSPGRVTYCHVVKEEKRCGYAQSTCQDLVSDFGGYCQRQ